jgi:GWxTD domain-containing protein
MILVRYLITPEEQHILESLGDKGKTNFLIRYWKENDDDPTTPQIEKRDTMIERYFFANKIFSTNAGRTNGWSTDRGRIHMTYGEPDERNDYPAPRVGNPFEVWYYHSIGEGKFFIFEDRTGADDFRIVHSNVEGELYDKDWQDLMDQGYVDFKDFD